MKYHHAAAMQSSSTFFIFVCIVGRAEGLAPLGMPSTLTFIDTTIPFLVTSSMFDITLRYLYYSLFKWQCCGISGISYLDTNPFETNLSHWLKTPWPPSLPFPRPARGPRAHSAPPRAERRHPALSCEERSGRSPRTEWLGLGGASHRGGGLLEFLGYFQYGTHAHKIT